MLVFISSSVCNKITLDCSGDILTLSLQTSRSSDTVGNAFKTTALIHNVEFQVHYVAPWLGQHALWRTALSCQHKSYETSVLPTNKQSHLLVINKVKCCKTKVFDLKIGKTELNNCPTNDNA